MSAYLEPDRVPVAHGGLYWLIHNYITGPLSAFYQRHKQGIRITFGSLAAILLITFVIMRPLWHPYAIAVMNHLPLVYLLAIASGVAIWWVRKHHGWKQWAIGSIAAAAIASGAYYLALPSYHFINLWARYEWLNRVPLNKPPLTAHERMQPYLTIVTDVNQKISGGQEASAPNLVRIGRDYFWTVLIGPGYWTGQLFGSMKTVKVISATESNPLWKDEPVDFGIGESQWLSHDIHTCVVRGLGPLRFWSYEPAEVKAMKNDADEMVQVVTLTKWSGFGYRPEFGGVVVVKQGESPLFTWEWLKLVATGCGEWIRPEEIKNHAFLQKQSLVPYAVGRYIAESFRFRGGFLDTSWGFHIDDVRIPQIADDGNEQPIMQYLTDIPGEDGKQYQTFSLEPFNPGKHGFSLAVMIPGDGSSNRVYTYEPSGLTGVSAIPAKVRPTNTIISWETSFPSEPRWFVRDINGQRMFFIYTSIVTKDVREEGRANAGTTSDIPVTDPRGLTQTFWMKEAKPDAWVKRLEREFGPAK